MTSYRYEVLDYNLLAKYYEIKGYKTSRLVDKTMFKNGTAYQ